MWSLLLSLLFILMLMCGVMRDFDTNLKLSFVCSSFGFLFCSHKVLLMLDSMFEKSKHVAFHDVSHFIRYFLNIIITYPTRNVYFTHFYLSHLRARTTNLGCLI